MATIDDNNGSSLRAQGTHFMRSEIVISIRFIPAGAGNTHPPAVRHYAQSVHPCGRREHSQQQGLVTYYLGSSLRAQGTLRSCAACSYSDRFIPAGAGNTSSPSAPSSPFTVHPCGRREHELPRDRQRLFSRFIPAGAGNTYTPYSPVYIHPGSSLRAQGTLSPADHVSRLMRFIPAGAGNTSDMPPPCRQRAVHPCGRREHSRSISL